MDIQVSELGTSHTTLPDLMQRGHPRLNILFRVGMRMVHVASSCFEMCRKPLDYRRLVV